jgi:hypothetical protein
VLVQPLPIVVQLETDIVKKHLDYHLNHDLHSFMFGANLGVPLPVMESHEVQLMGQEVAVDHVTQV